MLMGAVPALANEGPDQRASEDANSAANNVGESVTDNFITAKIKAKYATDSIVKNSDVDVKTTDHAWSSSPVACPARPSAIARWSWPRAPMA